MSRQEALEQYGKALKMGQKYRKDAIMKGRYPYPQALEEILDENMVAGRMDLGLLEIPAEQIVGTREHGRQNAFAGNFMPLLPANSEFGAKWVNLCCAHLSPSGIRDPIKCFEYLGRFYVQEGNKRVSVLLSYGAPTISAYVIRIIPVYSEDPDIHMYYEFLDFYRLSRLYPLSFRQPGSFLKLQAALGYEPDHVWSQEERQSFLSGFTFFREAFQKLGGDTLSVTPAEALLTWLRVYTFGDIKESSLTELTRKLSAIWKDILLCDQPAPIAVRTEPMDGEDQSLRKRIFSPSPPSHLDVAFLYEQNPIDSAWTAAHDRGRQYLEDCMGDKVTVCIYQMDGSGKTASELIETAIADGAKIIFTITPPMVSAAAKAAAQHPEVRILNCSVAMPYTGIRSYYSRVYEGKFITGAIAGAMSKDNRIGYVASYPIFGVPASINAFALGAQMTNPNVRISLHWSCTPGTVLDVFTRQGISIISNRDTPDPSLSDHQWGTYRVFPDGTLESLASPYWDWGQFYQRVVSSVLRYGWDAIDMGQGQQAVNFWWGMGSGVIDVQLSPKLPAGVRQLAEILRCGIINGTIDPFRRPIRSQDGTIQNPGDRWLRPEEILHMNWLCDNVDGSIPGFSELLPMSQPIVRLLGIYRDSIPPEKGEAPL